ncbi:hypothetical protein Sphch_3034 [Sphingobium chlorophenolicum L-1]|uniref:Uncharacterized protein n=2 Tax=Sphingobium chlorophenolicum TaxID=46429 RepID=F6F2J6_SPHCR|nr:hypothetical protein Sphch_3034 [Sphingobium chlorophenolicum L-1]
MTHPYLARSQAWALALRTLMGYPPHQPTRQTMSFCTSGPRDFADIVHLTQLATQTRTDMLHLTFAELDDPEPCLVSLVLHQPLCVEWMPGCQLYAASEKAPVELLQGERRWCIDDRNQLVSDKLPPRHLLVRGEQIAWARWRKAAADMDGIELTGNKFVPQGKPLADALPTEAIKVVG